MNAEVHQIMRRGTSTQQTAKDEVHQIRDEVRAALHAQEAGFRQQAPSCVQQTPERSEAAVAASTAGFQSPVLEMNNQTRLKRS